VGQINEIYEKFSELNGRSLKPKQQNINSAGKTSLNCNIWRQRKTRIAEAKLRLKPQSTNSVIKNNIHKVGTLVS